MSLFKNSMIALSLAFAFSAAHAQDATIQGDRQGVDSACATDAATAGCGKDQVGTGLLKCLHAYKKANPTYKFSTGCKAAMRQLHADKKAGK